MNGKGDEKQIMSRQKSKAEIKRKKAKAHRKNGYSKYLLLSIRDNKSSRDSDKTLRFFEPNETFYSPVIEKYTSHISDQEIQERLYTWKSAMVNIQD